MVFLRVIYLPSTGSTLTYTLNVRSVDIWDVLSIYRGIIRMLIHIIILAMNDQHGQIQYIILFLVLIVMLWSHLDVFLINKNEFLKDLIAELDLVLSNQEHCFEHFI